jgi:uncharacterized protein YfdQ (DUF2303 family)
MTSPATSTDRVENDVVAALAREATTPVEIDRGLYLLHNGQTVDVRKDLEKYEPQPRRKTGSYALTDVESFVSYLAKHCLPETELWANDKASTIRAVINAHGDTDDTGTGEAFAGWSDHTATLALPYTQDWRDWTGRDNKLQAQTEFAEFIEDHLPNFVTPTGADMLELAQSFQATTKVDFDSSQRLKSGETQLTYAETTTAAAGKKGTLAIPDTFELALQVHERGPVYRVKARFRYRINGGNLHLAYRLDRVDDVRRHAFDEVVAKVGADTGRQVWSSTS